MSTTVDELMRLITNRFTMLADVRKALTAALEARPAEPVGCTSAASDVLAERKRQVDVERWSPDHDDEHDEGSLAYAAACYARHTVKHFVGIPGEWPFEGSWWKPKSRRANLVRAAALLIAEIDRLDRAAPPTPGADHE